MFLAAFLLAQLGRAAFAYEPGEAHEHLPQQQRRQPLFSSTPNHKCSVTEQELDQMRALTLLKLNQAYLDISQLPVFDLDAFVAMLQPLFLENVEVAVSLGFGFYTGLRAAAEYIGLQFFTTNVGFVGIDYNSTRSPFLMKDPDNSNLWITAATSDMQLWKPVWQSISFSQPDGSFETTFRTKSTFEFEPCTAMIAKYGYGFLPNENEGGFFELVRWVVWAANNSKYGGMYDVCMFHDKFCTGVYKQYESFDDCLSYLNSLPSTPIGCPDTAPVGGNSRSCKLKHRSLIPFSRIHCFHIGKLNKADGSPNLDLDGQLKCSDEVECPLFEKAPKLVMAEPPEGFIQAHAAYEDKVDEDFEKDANGSFITYKFPPTGA